MDAPKLRVPGEAGRVLLEALERLAEDREDVRDALRSLQRWLASLLEQPARGRDTAGGTRGAREEARSGPASADPAPRSSPRSAPRPMPGVRAGLDARVSGPPGRADPEAPPRRGRPVDLATIARRARWKAAACRFATDRRRAAEHPERQADLRRVEQGLRKQREQLEECYAWMLDSPRPLPDDRLLGEVGACYETVALVAEGTLELARSNTLEPAPPPELLYLLAEAQSALLAALHKCNLRGDSDQRDLFLWLKDQTTRHRIYVDRHMRLDDPADSTASDSLSARFRALYEDLSKRRKLRQARGRLLNKMRYHVHKSIDGGAADDHDWGSVTTAVDQWFEQGLTAEDRALQELLRPFVEEHRGDRVVGASLERVFAAAPKARRQRRENAGCDGDGRPAAVAQAVELLAGRPLLIFAEQERAGAQEALKGELKLGDLRWIELPQEGLEREMEAEITRPDVEMVLIATRLPQEAYARFKRLCQAHGKPFVRLPAGLEPGQVAHQILRQVGWRLRADAQERAQTQGESRTEGESPVQGRVEA